MTLTLFVTSVLSFISVYEGLSLKTYKDPSGVKTVCYGHTQTASKVSSYHPVVCDGLLLRDTFDAMATVEQSLDYSLPSEVLLSLTSFVYNVGQTAYRSSTLLERLRYHRYEEACDELLRWKYSKGVVLRGLERRRHSEWLQCRRGFDLVD